ncbi:glycosyl hydrolase family protein [Catenulispora subtropica]|uniref:Ricin B lectin domain-containing protein n=1 Tax=Catenulispora subtropica TaxID=450798 RepID=A0ABP5ELJ5_9ACTN
MSYLPARGRVIAAATTALALVAPVAPVTGSAAPAAAATSVITISSTTVGTSLTDSSEGLSFEASNLAQPAFTGGNLAAYLKTLSPSSVIRIGGNKSDQTFWTSTGESAPSWSVATITPAGLTALAGLASSTGWKVILGVNLKQYDPARAANEAKFAQQTLGSSLQDIEIGNEPDLYSKYANNTSQYLTDFQAYVAAIQAAAPGVPIEGSDEARGPGSSFQSAFVGAQHALPHPQINELTNHFYPLTGNGCGGAPTIADLLGTTVRDAEKAEADAAVASAAPLGVPAVVDETNNADCGGAPGVSNVFASALWEIDEQLVMAREGVSGDFMHGGVAQCGTAMPYTPLCAPTASDAAAGDVVAQPEYYGMAAVRALGDGQFLDLDNPVWADVRTYAVRHADGTLSVLLDDVDDPATTGATTVQLTLPASFSRANQVDLTASGGLSATSGITLGGQTVHADGTLPAPTPDSIAVGGTTLTVTIPAGSARILSFGNGSGPSSTTLVGGLSGKCLSVSGGSTQAGATADIYTCNGSAGQNWTLQPGGEIVGVPSGDCLGVVGGATAVYSGVDIEACDGSAGQLWNVTPAGTIVGVGSGLCLSVLGASTANYATADIYTCNGSPSETWSQKPAA